MNPELKEWLGLTHQDVMASAALAITMAGCATIGHGGKQAIQVTTTPSHADVLVNGVKSETTPARIQVRRKDRGIVVRLEKDGYEPAEVALVRRTSRWMAADVLWSLSQLVNQGLSSRAEQAVSSVAILVGSLLVDHLTGAAYAQKPEVIHVALRPAAAATPAEPRKSMLLPARSAARAGAQEEVEDDREEDGRHDAEQTTALCEPDLQRDAP